MGVGYDDVRSAYDRIRGDVHRTPVLTCAAIDAMVGTRCFFKCENFQKVGAFKFRGALNAVRSLSEEQAARGVVTHSSGNHAQAVALAAKQRGIPAYIVMPSHSPSVKVAAVKGYGAEVTMCAPALDARETTAAKRQAETGAHLIHPYNDDAVIAGQGTAALELLTEVPELALLLTPVGGGGLLSGSALVAKAQTTPLRVIGAEPAGADDAHRSFHSGVLTPVVEPNTVADGLRTSLGDKTFAVIQEYVDDIVRVEDEAIIVAMRIIWERMKIVVEPSAAIALAVLLERKVSALPNRVGLILSGGNVDLEKLPF